MAISQTDQICGLMKIGKNLESSREMMESFGCLSKSLLNFIKVLVSWKLFLELSVTEFK